jgi:hypothetical protein
MRAHWIMTLLKGPSSKVAITSGFICARSLREATVPSIFPLFEQQMISSMPSISQEDASMHFSNSARLHARARNTTRCLKPTSLNALSNLLSAPPKSLSPRKVSAIVSGAFEESIIFRSSLFIDCNYPIVGEDALTLLAVLKRKANRRGMHSKASAAGWLFLLA